MLRNYTSIKYTFFFGNKKIWNERNSRRCNFVLGCSALCFQLDNYKLKEQKDGSWTRN